MTPAVAPVHAPAAAPAPARPVWLAWLSDPGLEPFLAAAALAAAVALVLAFSGSDALRRPVAVLAASAFLSVACLSPGPAVRASVPSAEAFTSPGDVECIKSQVQGQPTCVPEPAEDAASMDADQRCRFLTDALGKTGSYTRSEYPFLDNGRIRSYFNGSELDQNKPDTCYIIPTDDVLPNKKSCNMDLLGVDHAKYEDIVSNVEIDEETHKCNVVFKSDEELSELTDSDLEDKVISLLDHLEGKNVPTTVDVVI
jgi:hypothetical protein